MAKNNVLVNGLSAVTSGSSGILMTSPDVCKTTCGPATVPIPYPNIAESKDLASGSTSVMIEGNPVCLESSTFAKSTGDESGDQKGTVSNTIQDEAKPGLFSPTVFIEGKAIVRNTDIFTSNKMNTPPAPVMQAQVGPGVGSSSEYELQEFSQQLNIELAEQDDGEALDFILGHQLIVIANTADGKNVQRQIHQVEGNILPTRIYTTEEQELHTHLIYSQHYDSMKDESIVTPMKITALEKKDLQFSRKGMNLLKNVERLRLKPYDDQTGKLITKWVKGATIGYGYLVPKTEWSLYKFGITKIEASSLFLQSLTPFIDTVNKSITISLSQNEFDACVILAFNIGKSAFSSSSAVKLINNPNSKTTYSSLEQAWKAWNKYQEKINRGLINRRECEWQIYLNNTYKNW